MRTNHTLPLIQAFLVCQEIWLDERSQRDMLLHPFHYVPAEEFPLNLHASVYLQVHDGHGRYQLELLLRDMEGEVIWRWQPGAFEHTDPRFPHRLALHDLILPIPEAGRYDLVAAMNGEDAACQTLTIGPRDYFLVKSHDGSGS
jgi:hypothetical protein